MWVLLYVDSDCSARLGLVFEDTRFEQSSNLDNQSTKHQHKQKAHNSQVPVYSYCSGTCLVLACMYVAQGTLHIRYCKDGMVTFCYTHDTPRPLADL